MKSIRVVNSGYDCGSVKCISGRCGTLLRIVCTMFIAVALFALMGCSNSHGTPEEIADLYMQYCFNQDVDADTGLELLEPSMMERTFEIADVSEDDAVQQMESYRADMFEDLDEELGEGWTYSTEIVSEEPYEESDMFETQFFLANYSYNSEAVEEGEVVTVEVTVAGESGESVSKEERLYILKCDDEWFMDPNHFSFDIDW